MSILFSLAKPVPHCHSDQFLRYSGAQSDARRAQPIAITGRRAETAPRRVKSVTVQGINYALSPHQLHQRFTLIEVPLAGLMPAIAGQGVVKGRLAVEELMVQAALSNLTARRPVQAPQGSIRDGRPRIDGGHHRIRALAKSGLTRIAVAVPLVQAERFAELAGGNQRGS